MSKRVAVIDIGSNTIKLLVAGKSEESNQGLDTLHRNTLETRIGQGLSAARLVFSPDVLARASEAVGLLVEEARKYSPDTIRIVATSAARDAENGDELGAAILRRAGLPLEILSGRREAELIGTAIALDPGITARDFYVFDLGGGSVECLSFANRSLDQVASVPLGCVRLSEKIVADPRAVFTPSDEQSVAAEIRRVLDESGFVFSLPAGAIAVGTGGTLTTALNIVAHFRGLKLEEMPSYLPRADLRDLLKRIGGLPFTERLHVKGLSAGRADVFPTALATFLTLIGLTGQDGIHHSLLNLRYGLAVELLNGNKSESLTGD